MAVPDVCLTASVRRVPALEVSLLLVHEPVLTPARPWLVHREVPGPAVLRGGAIILAVTALRAARS
jgi:drug/metabolite transporter (DMT)-like permease